MEPLLSCCGPLQAFCNICKSSGASSTSTINSKSSKAPDAKDMSLFSFLCDDSFLPLTLKLLCNQNWVSDLGNCDEGRLGSTTTNTRTQLPLWQLNGSRRSIQNLIRPAVAYSRPDQRRGFLIVFRDLHRPGILHLLSVKTTPQITTCIHNPQCLQSLPSSSERLLYSYITSIGLADHAA